MQFQRKMMLPSIMLVAVLLTASFASAVFMHKIVAVVYAQDSAFKSTPYGQKATYNPDSDQNVRVVEEYKNVRDLK